ncbi:MAG: zinc-binding dehydrogenase [Alphaproteobacteria bacterium]|jgi:threonine dehydrogenase-like Zn-dependent dehydrogenase|nr:iditol 2-dehydrogenase [Rhodospirillaceae bacterium]MDP6022498.1 zinc-binding dehydrogenase [Alphaproteobacteria bacterium]MDP6255517.1 zinc-binding dehydrogenase [Alphaproteobacteria bacterium]MDP7056530.1 zinc-binding dehydrogenase [Alphaproteobacteria bacterium]MDP7229495.1 zinc-binding dehydrogenase [Alphaproteobacteria bacterium]|tara:strand:+ start:23331 stop:24386 length:1056 start_codon:yes stop_codon:yes gene_type:complete
MKGVVFIGESRTELREFPDPQPGPRDVILEIKASGMCGTDLKGYREPFIPGVVRGGIKRSMEPVIAGHEPCGIVVELGSAVTGREARIGQRVIDFHYDGCGVCRHCMAGWRQMCADGAVVFGSVAHGAHAPYMKVPVESLVTLPDELSFETGAAIACGTGTAFGALQRLSLHGDETIAVFGQGPVGLSVTQLAHAMGARVIALDISPERRQLAAELGADVVLDPMADDPVQAIRDLTHGEGAEKTLDASSSAQARAQAVRATRAWGACCYVGEGGEVTLEVSPDLLRRQVTLIGSWTFSNVGLADCARFVADRGVDVDRLFTHRWKLDQAEEAYQLFDQQKTGKGVFLPAS